MRRFSTSVTITDPLVKYRSFVATGAYCADPAQHRLAKHLQQVYGRLKDYTPSSEYRQRLKQIADLVNKPKSENSGPTLAVEGHPIWRNPLFRRLFTAPEGNHSLALTRVLTSHESALEIDSPRGLFLSGEVGTGKSMLIDLLSEGLPTHRKKRWHFNTFMLYTFSQLEKFRRANPGVVAGGDQEYSLLWMAKKLAEESPILFLDEFQLPDRAASKIMSHLFIAFFQLGGVLIASSNRVPEELQKAIGAEYTPPPMGGFVKNFFSGTKPRGRGELFGTTSDFAAFLEVLKARCDFWHMEGATDWRRREEGTAGFSDETAVAAVDSKGAPGALLAGHGTTAKPILSAAESNDDPLPKTGRPAKYFLPTDKEEEWRQAWNLPGTMGWTPETLVVYGRSITISQQRDGYVYWDFEELVESSGPADYITMASTYHTFIIDNVPILTIMKKNEARRFITLLDALYEAKCKLIVRASQGPDELFFPETRAADSAGVGADADADQESVVDADAIHSETIAEAHQDSAAPFRPNISFYDTPSSTSRYDPDQDSDFGLENTRQAEAEKKRQRDKLDFSNTGAFTGEDERFAYKRAASRLWEMCGMQWHSRMGDWWRPLPAEARHWERSPASKPLRILADGGNKLGSDMTVGPSVELDEPAGLQGLRIEALKQLERKDR